MILRSVIIVVLVVGILSPASQSLRFELQSGYTKCISEDIKSNSMTVGKYQVVNPNPDHPLPDSHKLTVRVSSPNGNTYHRAEKVETGQFAFTAAEEGGYTACFWADDHSPRITMTVDFDWRTGVHAKDWSNIAKEGQVVVMELELKKLYDVVTSIHDEMFYLRGREEEMQELNKATTSKMFWLSFLSLFLCLSVAGLQFWHLKTFFEKKKII
ncbi:Transmembrane emp24 domain-containing protein p24delta9 [Hibiscus syriacus]|uniref:Transmembrane emp24 domain-containing protein p24delta9 n=1 Tax=Hibiscus syriacus TaxID=106335 RepID=A0A6A3CKW7_HIBSY|nr:transmembrane emp24 domain-containing protein p24delta9-like [Hibiscus syriacus]KAE8727898.1 Transmembrane emp24 domain-containing protein p24delta9 [Hibiscus syriacus]